MNETNRFRILDHDKGEWLPLEEIEEVMQINWHTSGANKGQAWAELKFFPKRNLEMIFAECDERNGRLRVALKETLLELEQWQLTEHWEPARTILKNGFKLLSETQHKE